MPLANTCPRPPNGQTAKQDYQDDEPLLSIDPNAFPKGMQHAPTTKSGGKPSRDGRRRRGRARAREPNLDSKHSSTGSQNGAWRMGMATPDNSRSINPYSGLLPKPPASVKVSAESSVVMLRATVKSCSSTALTSSVNESVPVPTIPIDINTVRVGDFVYLDTTGPHREWIELVALGHPSVIAHVNLGSDKLLLLTATTFGSSSTEITHLGQRVYSGKTYVSIHPADPGDNEEVLQYAHPGAFKGYRDPAWLCISKLYEVFAKDITYVRGRKGDAICEKSMRWVKDKLADDHSGGTLIVFRTGKLVIPQNGCEEFFLEREFKRKKKPLPLRQSLVVVEPPTLLRRTQTPLGCFVGQSAPSDSIQEPDSTDQQCSSSVLSPVENSKL